MKAHVEVEERLPSFLPLVLDRDERSAPHPNRFTSGEKPPVAGGLQRRSERFGEVNTVLSLRRSESSSPVTIPPELSKLICNTQAKVRKSANVVYSAACQLFKPVLSVKPTHATTATSLLRSFCVGGTGDVYEGRGWDVQGAHAPRYNIRSTGICVIGDYLREYRLY
jgi:hypothetical protein